MFVLGNMIQGLAAALGMILRLYMYVLIGRAIISWVNADPRNAIVRFLLMLTEPPLRLIRRRLPLSLQYFPLDISFLVLFGLVIFAQYALVQSLFDIGVSLRRPVFR
jgi:YggT family protein